MTLKRMTGVGTLSKDTRHTTSVAGHFPQTHNSFSRALKAAREKRPHGKYCTQHFNDLQICG